MSPQQRRALIELISTIVKSEGAWVDKRNDLIDEATDDEKTDIAEFAAWFE